MSAPALAAPLFPANFEDDTRFVQKALATFLDRHGLAPHLEFRDLKTSEQSQVLQDAQMFKRGTMGIFEIVDAQPAAEASRS